LILQITLFYKTMLNIKPYSIIFLILVFVSDLSFSQDINYGNNVSAGKYASINGINLYYEVYGEGTPVLLLHGNGGKISAFKKNIPYFSKGYKVVAIDSRSQGKSFDTGDSLSFEMMADDFGRLLQTLKLDSCYVIGWSDGGIIALLMAIRFPEKVKKIAISGANIFADSTAFIPGMYKQMADAYAKNKNADVSKPETKNAWKLFLLDYLQPRLRFSDLMGIKCPSLVIAGDRDLISLEHTSKIYQNIPGAQLWILPHSGHATLIEHAEEFNKKVDLFFKGY
jgi:pimeloyl-ACP methyl ester carboxylesterase